MSRSLAFATLLASTLHLGCSIAMDTSALVAGTCSPLSGVLCQVPAILTECADCTQYYYGTYTVIMRA